MRQIIGFQVIEELLFLRNAQIKHLLGNGAVFGAVIVQLWPERVNRNAIWQIAAHEIDIKVALVKTECSVTVSIIDAQHRIVNPEHAVSKTRIQFVTRAECNETDLCFRA